MKDAVSFGSNSSKHRTVYFRPLVSVLALLILGLVVVPSGARAQTPQLRMSWQSFVSGPDGAKRLASLQAAVQKMKSLNSSPHDSPDYRRSWEYWANIHGYYGANSPDGTIEDQVQYLKSNGMRQYASYYQGLTDLTAPDTTAETVWATCQHSGDSPALNFLGWHRMYLFFFEKVLRWAANDDTLRLPYWDYTNPAQVALPAEFRDTASVLFDSRRAPDLNANRSTLSSRRTNADSLLAETDFFTFESQLEGGLHGYIHCSVGPTCPVAHMGDVPLAANDPVFYSHHANIDRMWACWQKLHGTPQGDWQNQQFSFVDETGTMQTLPVKNFLDSTTSGYAYDNESNCTRVRNVSMAGATPAAGSGAKRATIATANGVAITQPDTSININPPHNVAGPVITPTELVLRDVIAEQPPGVLFDVYLAPKADPTKRQLVGTISWFGAFHHHGVAGPSKRTLRFNISQQLHDMGIAPGTPLSAMTVTVEASHGRVSTDPAQAAAVKAAAAAAFRPQANLHIGGIDLEGPAPASTPSPQP